ncbi:hypothetical protein GCM10011584_32110 [Nocardioides phosphati]|uniref:DUF222 domain-containing protein n=1 Tax=Nocardioides phosphati TaxID=1867775 RepID=A0ABQ2NF06_9ACTN|nr:hypothetical protein [Nocardioides phosphati]GGO93431.1 hypothetical protein GCM10011584_32110 [Nocardioides phosphati]
MNWEAFHRRGDVLQAVIKEADVRRDGELPMYVAGVEQVFRDELDLLGALSLRWHTRLSGHTETIAKEQPLDLEQATIEAWRGAADEIPGVRLVLDKALAEGDDEVVEILERSREKERELLALNSGRISAYQLAEHGARVGAAVEAKAREGFEIGANWVPEPVPTLFERIKAGTRSRTSAIA